MPTATPTISITAPPEAMPPELPPAPPIIPEEMKLPLILLIGGVAVLGLALVVSPKKKK